MNGAVKRARCFSSACAQCRSSGAPLTWVEIQLNSKLRYGAGWDCPLTNNAGLGGELDTSHFSQNRDNPLQVTHH